MQTGLERYRFTMDEMSASIYYGYYCAYGGCYFSVSSDNSTLFVGADGGLGVWNLNTLEYSIVDVQMGTAYARRAVVSPDGRYLVVARALIRVWDLTALPEDFNDRDPVLTFDGPLARASTVRIRGQHDD
ncbi:MAG: WD40 repeat domain-containing protein [Anaerolineae bacterium]